jgi:hypothetical protein
MFKKPETDSSSDEEYFSSPKPSSWLKTKEEKPKSPERHPEKTCYHKIKYLEKRIRQLEFLILNKK